MLEELQRTNVNEVPPIELMAKVQEWQERNNALIRDELQQILLSDNRISVVLWIVE